MIHKPIPVGHTAVAELLQRTYRGGGEVRVQAAGKVCRRLGGGVAPAGVHAAGKGLPQFSAHCSQNSRPADTDRPDKLVVEQGARGPSSGQWGLRTREHCVPAGALGPPVPTNHLSLCGNLPGFSQLSDF